MSSLEMSFYYVFTHNFELWKDGYECPENATKFGPTWPRFGIYCYASGGLMLTMYILCFLAICKAKKFTPAYQLMFLISIHDITNLIIGSIITGNLTYHGISFCHSPEFFFAIGGIAMTAWLTSCAACILLAIERCVEVNPRFFLNFLFEKKVFMLVIFCLLAYNVCAFLFCKPVIFNPDYSCFVFDPMVGKDPNLYTNLWLAYNNIIVAVSTTALYFYLCYYLIFKFGYSTSMWLYKSKRQIIMQGVILCFFHAAAATTYEFIQFIPPPLWLITMGQVLWQLSCGCMSIAYLTLNRTIRNSVLKMIIPKTIRAWLGLHIGVEEHQAVERAADENRGAVNAQGAVIKFDNFFQN